MTEDQFAEIQKFNRNIDWLRKNHVSAPIENLNEWIRLGEALQILERGRTWIQTRMIKPEEIDGQPMNLHWFLVRGIDWEREGNKLVFKRSSISRLKSEMRRLGEAYEERLRSIN